MGIGVAHSLLLPQMMPQRISLYLWDTFLEIQLLRQKVLIDSSKLLSVEVMVGQQDRRLSRLLEYKIKYQSEGGQARSHYWWAKVYFSH